MASSVFPLSGIIEDGILSLDVAIGNANTTGSRTTFPLLVVSIGEVI